MKQENNLIKTQIEKKNKLLFMRAIISDGVSSYKNCCECESGTCMDLHHYTPLHIQTHLDLLMNFINFYQRDKKWVLFACNLYTSLIIFPSLIGFDLDLYWFLHFVHCDLICDWQTSDTNTTFWYRRDFWYTDAAKGVLKTKLLQFFNTLR